MEFYCVYKTGGDFGTDYVDKMYEYNQKFFPSLKFNCISDDPKSIGYRKSQYPWAGFWSKMELFKPSIKGDIFFMDLDTVIVDNIELELEIIQKNITFPLMIKDMYFPERAQYASGIMFLPEKFRKKVWDYWIGNPNKHIQRVGAAGDQKIISEIFYDCGSSFDKFFANLITSYKYIHPELMPDHIRKKLETTGESQVTGKEKIICYHGKPRPRDTNWDGNFNFTFSNLSV